MVTPDAYVDAVARAGRKPALQGRGRRRGVRGLRDAQAPRRPRRLRRPARPRRARPRGGRRPFAAAQRWRFRHLFVDELQDVNPLQFRLLEAWRGDRYDVTAVGDPQQAIYGWNGADAGFLLDIHRWWPPAEVIELDRSYRSTPEILDGAAAVLRGARQPARDVRGHPCRRVRRPTSPATRTTAPRPSPSPAPCGSPAPRAGGGRSRRCSCGPTPRPTCSPRRSAARASRTASAAAPPSSTDRTCGGRLRDLRDATVPLGTALADLELQLEAQALEADELRRPPRRRGSTRVPWSSTARPTSGPRSRALLRMGRDYLRLDPVGRADTFSSLADRHRAVRGRPSRRPRRRRRRHVPRRQGPRVGDGAPGRRGGRLRAHRPRPHRGRPRRGGAAALRGDDPGPARAADLVGRAAHLRRQGRRAPPIAAPRPAGAAAPPTAAPVDRAGILEPPGRRLVRRRSPASSEAPAASPRSHGRPGARRAAPLAGRAPPAPRASTRRPCCPTTCSAASSPPAPRDVDELGAVRGVGPILASRFGDAMLGALALAGGRERGDR